MRNMMNCNNHIFVLCLVFGLNMALGQTPRDRIKSLKVSYITKELDLTTEEATKFWPIYFEYDEELEENRRKQTRKIMQELEDVDELSEAEIQQLIQEYLKTEKTLYTAQERLIENLHGVLPGIKILKLLKAEKGFNRRMLERFKNRNFMRQDD